MVEDGQKQEQLGSSCSNPVEREKMVVWIKVVAVKMDLFRR